MKTLAWNCRGLGNPRAQRSFRLLVRQRSPQIIFLSETKLTVNEANVFRSKCQWRNMISVPCQSRKGGLILLWNDEVNLCLRSYSRLHIDAEITEADGRVWRLTGFYGESVAADRGESWNCLKNLGRNSLMPWVILGDFNETLHDNEQLSINRRPATQIVAFRDVVDQLEMQDLGYEGYKYTWCNRRDAENNVQVRLDRALGNNQWISLYPHYKVLHLPFASSDHCPILLDSYCNETRVHRDGVRRRFRFEKMWLSHDDCKNIIKESWDDMPGSINVSGKLERLSDKLFDWNATTFGHVGRKIKELQAEMCRARNEGQPFDSNKIKSLEAQLDRILENEEIMWKQRSRNNWLAEGDRNTKFFHSTASYRRKKNRIVTLRDENGMEVEDEVGKMNISVDYFSNLFKSNGFPRSSPISELVKDRVTPQMNQLLSSDYTAEEIKTALLQMGALKAPGPDGYPALFYQKFWEVVGGDVVDLVMNFLHTGSMPDGINHTAIVLIPKVDNPVDMTQFRPISLCNVIYKIIAKVLANRLKQILPDF